MSDLSLRVDLPQTEFFAKSAIADGRPDRVQPPASRDEHRLELHCIRSRQEFNALEADWTALYERSGKCHHTFQTYNWCWHWCETYLREGTAGATELAIVTGRVGGELVMIWPLLIEHGLGMRQVKWLGEPVSQYGDAIVKDDARAGKWLEAAWRQITEALGADLVVLNKVRADANVAQLLAEHQVRVAYRQEAPELALGDYDDFEHYQTRFSPKKRRNRRRHWRRLSELGSLEFVSHAEGEKARELALAAIDLKRKWLADRGLASRAYAHEDFDIFFASVARDPARSAGCQVSALLLDGVPIAVEIGFVSKGRYGLHISVFDIAYEPLGAGAQKMLDTIRHCYDAGYHTYDLQAPADPYKLGWTNRSTPVIDYIAPASLKGRLLGLGYYREVRPRAKRLVAAMPRNMRRRIAPLFAAVMRK